MQFTDTPTNYSSYADAIYCENLSTFAKDVLYKIRVYFYYGAITVEKRKMILSDEDGPIEVNLVAEKVVDCTFQSIEFRFDFENLFAEFEFASNLVVQENANNEDQFLYMNCSKPRVTLISDEPMIADFERVLLSPLVDGIRFMNILTGDTYTCYVVDLDENNFSKITGYDICWFVGIWATFPSDLWPEEFVDQYAPLMNSPDDFEENFDDEYFGDRIRFVQRH